MITNDPLVWTYVTQFAQAANLPFMTYKDRENAFELYLANAAIKN
jgi:hypothetical protein